MMAGVSQQLHRSRNNIFAIYAVFFVGILFVIQQQEKHQFWTHNNNQSQHHVVVKVVQAYTTTSRATICYSVRQHSSKILSHHQQQQQSPFLMKERMVLSLNALTKDQNLESNIILAATLDEVSLSTPSDVGISNDDDDDDESKSSSSIAEEMSSDNNNHMEALTTTTTDLSSSTTTTNSELNIWAARGLLLLVAAIWGTNFASVKYLENLCFHPPCHHPPSEAALARFGLAAIVSIPLLFNQKWNVIQAGLECGLWISLGYCTQALALSTIDAGQCAFICSLTVVFVPVAAAVLYQKPIRPYNLLAACIALAGVGVLEGMINIPALLGIAPAIAATTTSVVPHAMDMTSTTTSLLSTALPGADTNVVSAVSDVSTGPLVSLANIFGVNKGDILALGQPIGFGTAFLRIEQYQEHLKDVPNRILTIAAAQCVAVGIMSFFWVLYDFHGTIPNFGYMIEPHRIAAIGWTGIITTVVAIYIEGIALQKASATDASLAFSTEPIWASLFGFILLHERLGINSYVGGALILTACLVGAIADLRIAQRSQIGSSEE